MASYELAASPMMSPAFFESSPMFRSLCVESAPPAFEFECFDSCGLEPRPLDTRAMPVPEHFNRKLSFYTSESATEMLQRMSDALVEVGFDIVVEDLRWRVAGTAVRDGAFVKLFVHVFEAFDDRRLIEFQLRQGDRAAFRCAIAEVVDHLELMDITPCVKPSALFAFHDSCDSSASDPLAMPSLQSRGRNVIPNELLLRRLVQTLGTGFVDVQLETLQVLAGMCLSIEGASAVCSFDPALRKLVASMSSTNSEVAILSIDTVCGLAKHETHRDALVDCGVVDVLVKVLETGRSDVVAHTLACLSRLEGIEQHHCWSRISPSLARLHSISVAKPIGQARTSPSPFYPHRAINALTFPHSL